ncbi:pseudouridine synthase [Parabacteroides sp. An277]|uniref:pseudouridine synthase n=1 Tax=Parabacteroides sp. An277 TaxID=1965619 RepID=UPI000B383C67|nr:pseudouridine synthase [Parabacteroides sp. An277]OUO49280.1 pseudouridine synthase [Parabacteroides sp. An277]
MNIEEKDEAQQQPSRPKNVIPSISKENAQDDVRKPYNAGYRPEGNYERRPYNRQGQNERGNYRPYGNRPAYNDYGNGQNYQPRYDNRGERPNYGNNRPYNNRGNYNPNQGGYGNRPYGNRPAYGNEPQRPYNRPAYNQGPIASATPNGPVEGGVVKKRRPRVGENRIPASYDMEMQRGGNRPYNNNYGNNPRGGNGRYNNNHPNNNRRPNNNRKQGNYNPNAKYSHQKQLKYKEVLADPNEPIRLNKYLANAGVCSRREADEFIQKGCVKVNDVVITELGTKITRSDKVTFNDKPVQIESKVYIVLNKPKNCVTTSDDPQERLTVMDLVKNACTERIYPVGRLDRNTTGVLLLTNDGDLASKLTHPSFKKKKIYHVWLDKEVAVEDMEKIANGLELEDGEIHADAISYANETDKKQVGIEIHSGRNRIVRRIFESLGYHVTKLDRVYFAGLTKKNLGRGKWRYLNEREVNALRMGAFE